VLLEQYMGANVGVYWIQRY